MENREYTFAQIVDSLITDRVEAFLLNEQTISSWLR